MTTSDTHHSDTDTTERASIVTYMLLREFHHAVAARGVDDDVVLGIIMGTAMFCDDMIGPFRSKRLMAEAPDVVLRTDAHVSEALAKQFASVLESFAEYLGAARKG